MKLTVVIAAYDEEQNITPLTQRLIEACDGMPDTSWHLIYVIEGTDRTFELANQFAKARPEINIIYNERPSGLGRAFRVGFDAVPHDTDLVVTMDADLNHQPEEIPALISALLRQQADIVVGSRRMHESTVSGVPAWKNVLSRVINRGMQALIPPHVKDLTSGFRVYRAPTLRLIQFDNAGFAFLPEMLLSAASQGARVIEVPIQFIFRKAGTSKMALMTTSRSYLFFARTLLDLRKRKAKKDSRPE